MVEDHRGGTVTKIAASALDHRPFWDAMHAVTPSRWINWRRSASQCSAPGRGVWGYVSSVARTWLISPPSSIPITRRRRLPQRGKAKQKRSDLRLADLGLVVNRDGGIPLTWHASP
jgi:hypothetical protein